MLLKKTYKTQVNEEDTISYNTQLNLAEVNHSISTQTDTLNLLEKEKKVLERNLELIAQCKLVERKLKRKLKTISKAIEELNLLEEEESDEIEVVLEQDTIIDEVAYNKEFNR